ncbi:hypothetical protein EWI07_13385 [Sporolactobacillus sp. THM7-4]|nr:hypothetical protein EWI07_13385 [Sporolactobacillus sp. THM7-4]
MLYSQAQEIRMAVPILLVLLLSFTPAAPVSAQLPEPDQIIRTQRTADARTLIHTSDTVVLVHIDTAIRTWNTGRKLSADKEWVNARQKLNIRQVLKGDPSSPAYLLTTGIRPLPPPRDPLNEEYTGPLADGDYILFLKKFPAGPYYILNGGFSAVYPVHSGRTIALEGEGFPEFNGKTVSEIRALILR